LEENGEVLTQPLSEPPGVFEKGGILDFEAPYLQNFI
jgi:hypothetical protein